MNCIVLTCLVWLCTSLPTLAFAGAYCLVSSCLVCSGLASYYNVLPLLAMPCLRRPCTAMYCLDLSCLAATCHALSCLGCHCLGMHGTAWPCLVLHCLVLPGVAVPSVTMGCNAMPCRVLSQVALPCLDLPRLASSPLVLPRLVAPPLVLSPPDLSWRVAADERGARMQPPTWRGALFSRTPLCLPLGPSQALGRAEWPSPCWADLWIWMCVCVCVCGIDGGEEGFAHGLVSHAWHWCAWP